MGSFRVWYHVYDVGMDSPEPTRRTPYFSDMKSQGGFLSNWAKHIENVG